MHVLIVEDDTDSRNVLAVLLQRLGALVEAVASAKEAYDRVSHRRPDVLVSDIGMPEEDGYSLIRRVRQLGGERKAAGDCADGVCAQAGCGRGDRRRLRPPPAQARRARRSHSRDQERDDRDVDYASRPAPYDPDRPEKQSWHGSWMSYCYG